MIAPFLLWPIVKAFEDAVRNPVKVEYDGISNLIITDKFNNSFVIFMDCGEPDYLDHIEVRSELDRETVDFFDSKFDEAVKFMLTNNLVSFYSETILELAQQQPNWGYNL